MRYADTIVLIATVDTQTELGAIQTKADEREVFCNRFSVSFEEQERARLTGYRLIADVQLRSVEFKGETLARYQGREVDITGVMYKGEFVRLRLTERLANEQEQPQHDPYSIYPGLGGYL